MIANQFFRNKNQSISCEREGEGGGWERIKFSSFPRHHFEMFAFFPFLQTQNYVQKPIGTILQQFPTSETRLLDAPRDLDCSKLDPPGRGGNRKDNRTLSALSNSWKKLHCKRGKGTLVAALPFLKITNKKKKSSNRTPRSIKHEKKKYLHDSNLI